MPIHDQVLRAARRLCRERGGWTFRPEEIVRALPHLNPSSIRTHIVSRCCVNAPRHHPHRWEYFRRVAHGTYKILAAYRRETRTDGAGARHAGRPRDTVHAVVTRDGDWYVAECLKVAVVSQGRTLDEMVGNVRDAVTLHLEGGEAAAFGIASAPRIAFTYEAAPPAR